MTIKITWQVTADGIVPAGETAVRRTLGAPTTMTRIAQRFGARLRSVAPDLQRVRTLAALIATEGGGALDPTLPRYEPSLGDFSFGPVQMLTKTAAGLLGRAPHPPVIHVQLATPEAVKQFLTTDLSAQRWRAQLENRIVAGELAADYLRVIDASYACHGDPIMLYAGYNAGSPRTAQHPHDKFGLVSYVHKDGSTALDSFSKWYGDACVVFADLNTQPPPAVA